MWATSVKSQFLVSNSKPTLECKTNQAQAVVVSDGLFGRKQTQS